MTTLAVLAAEVPDARTCRALGNLKVPLQEAWFDEPNADPWPGLTLGSDTAAWTRLTRSLELGRIPAAGTVLPEEIMDALASDAAPPPHGQPFVLRAETAQSPWDPDAAVVRLTVTARRGNFLDRPPAHVVLVLDQAALEPETWPVARDGTSELVAGLRHDDMVTVIRTSPAQVVLGPTPADERQVIQAAIEGTASADGADVPGAMIKGWAVLRNAPERALRRMIVVSDGELSLIEQSGPLSRAATGHATKGIGLVGLSYGEKHGRDDSLEHLVRAAGGPTLHLAHPYDGAAIADHISALLEPAVVDLRLLVEWNADRVRGVHRIGNHHDRLTGLGPRGESVGGELGVGRTATVLYEVQLARGSSGSLGTVSAQGTPPGTRTLTSRVKLDGTVVPLEQASGDLRIAVAAGALAEIIGDAQPHERVPPHRVADLARQAARPEYPRDAQLVALADRATELLELRSVCHEHRRLWR